MAAFWQQRGRRQENGGLGSVIDGLGSVFDVLLANARLVLGVSGAAVLAIATLAVKRVRLGSEHGKISRRAELAPVWWGKMCPKPRCLLLSWFLAYGTNAIGPACSHPVEPCIHVPVCLEHLGYSIPSQKAPGT